MTPEQKIKSIIRDIPDFPQKGIVFKDITPVLKDAKICSEIADKFIGKFTGTKIDAIVCTESGNSFLDFCLLKQDETYSQNIISSVKYQ